uniref:Uncharacterized protein n=1 Tax=Oryza barthii TaxID=65489 RepID=A0A0D3ESB2_9ORYZ
MADGETTAARMAAGEQERQGGGVQRGGVHLSPLYLYFLRVFTDEEAAARDGLWKRSGARRLAGEEQRAAANLPVSSSSAAAVWIPPLSCRICTAAAMVLSPLGMARRVGTRKGGRSSGATTAAWPRWTKLVVVAKEEPCGVVVFGGSACTARSGSDGSGGGTHGA